MDRFKSFSKKLSVRVAFFLLLLVAALDAFVFYGLKLIAQPAVLNQKLFFQCFVPSTAVIWLFFTLVLWLVVKSLAGKEFSSDEDVSNKMKTPEEELKRQENLNKRFFLHLLSVLQRDARLLDFFFEKLDQFEDAQIGAAVRNIHENSYTTIVKYLSPEPVLDKNEGEDITIEKGFDPSTVKLTGNVTGEPPFKGVLRHRGWQAGELDLPTLSERENSLLISPAEVEIQ